MADAEDSIAEFGRTVRIPGQGGGLMLRFSRLIFTLDPYVFVLYLQE
jgi:hypothetical protein